MTQRIKLYGHQACVMVPPVRRMLKSAGVAYDYINIRDDESARLIVREINNGYESVPTLVFPDGSILTEPSGNQLSGKLQALGYKVPLSARAIAYMPQIITVLIVLFAIMRFVQVV